MELKSISQKSFYGKAKVEMSADRIYLRSYNTIVCSLNLDGADLRRHWGSWSATTMKHIKDFLSQFAICPCGDAGAMMNKKIWESLDVTPVC